MDKIENPFFALSFVASEGSIWKGLIKNSAWKPWNESLDENTQLYFQSIYHGNFYYQAFKTSAKDSSFLRKILICEQLPIVLKLGGQEMTLLSIQAFITKTGFSLFTFSIQVNDTLNIDEIISLILKNSVPLVSSNPFLSPA